MKKDLIFVGVILLFAGILLMWQKVTSSNGNRVLVSQDGEVIASYDLDYDHEELLTFESGCNYLKITAGKASIIQADCPDQICVHQPSICHVGETIICLPHKLVVEVTGNKEQKEEGYDAISQ